VENGVIFAAQRTAISSFSAVGVAPASGPDCQSASAWRHRPGSRSADLHKAGPARAPAASLGGRPSRRAASATDIAHPSPFFTFNRICSNSLEATRRRAPPAPRPREPHHRLIEATRATRAQASGVNRDPGPGAARVDQNGGASGTDVLTALSH